MKNPYLPKNHPGIFLIPPTIGLIIAKNSPPNWVRFIAWSLHHGEAGLHEHHQGTTHNQPSLGAFPFPPRSGSLRFVKKKHPPGKKSQDLKKHRNFWSLFGFESCFVLDCWRVFRNLEEEFVNFPKLKGIYFEHVAGWICCLVANLKCNIINHPKGSFIYYHILSMTFHISSPLPSQAIGTHVHPCYYTIRGYYTGMPPCILSPRILATYIVFHYVHRCMNIYIISTHIYIIIYIQ